jgi:hypothetical protein
MICIECDKPHDDPTFCYQNGIMAYGPAYWSDAGLLCSPECSTKHFLKRIAAGEKLIPAPMPRS